MLSDFTSQQGSRSLIINLLVTAATVFISVIALIYSSRIAGPLPISVSQTTTQKDSTFDVQGESEITFVPDQAEISLGMTSTQSTVAGAQDDTNRVINAITNSLKELGISEEDIKTTNYSINPQYDFENPDRRIIGYQVSANLRITIKDLSNLNQVIDTASGLGANQVGGINFTMSDELEDKTKKQAREEAITQAKESARELAKLSGVKLGKVVNVSENSPVSIQPVTRSFEAMSLDSAGGGAPTQVEPGSSTYTYFVTLSYETL